MSFELPSWLVTWLQGISVWDFALWVVGIVLLIIFIRRKGWRWVKAFAKAILATAEVIDSVQGLPDFIARTDATLATQNDRIGEIHHETHTNDGSSIKDAVQRVEMTAERLELGVKGLYDKVGELTDVDVQMRKDFDATQGGNT